MPRRPSPRRPVTPRRARSALSALSALSAIVTVSLAPVEAQASEPAYALHADTDLPALALGATFQASWLLRGQLAPPFCAPECDRGTLNALDRTVAGNWSPGWNDASNYGIAALLVGEAAVLFAAEGPSAGAQDGVVVVEAILWANGLGALTNFAVRRPRPFAYGTTAPLAERTDGNAAMSFFSGHTAVSFAATAALFTTLHRTHPKSALPWIALAVGGLGGAFIGTTRMLAGHHFPTDVLAGATVGTSLGFLIPALHGTGMTVSPLSDASGRLSGASLVGRF